MLQPDEQGHLSLEPISKEAFLIRTSTIGQDALRQMEESLESRFGQFNLFDFYT
ncbi:MAG: hypothetical protein GTO49_04705, partial [Anaerolineae bacterium]|nr:hypothetical protein [Anaerolineae bacterium]